MIKHKLEKGNIPKCRKPGFKAKPLTTGDPRLSYHWDYVTCEDCLALRHSEARLKDPALKEELKPSVENLAKSILDRHRSSDIEDWHDSDDD